MIRQVSTRDAHFRISHGHGSDAIRRDPVYSYAVTQLHGNRGRTGVGLAFTLGEGNQLVREAAPLYAQRLIGRPIEEIMVGFGVFQRAMGDEQQFRWLGPCKGVVQLALAHYSAPPNRGMDANRKLTEVRSIANLWRKGNATTTTTTKKPKTNRENKEISH